MAAQVPQAQIRVESDETLIVSGLTIRYYYYCTNTHKHAKYCCESSVVANSNYYQPWILLCCYWCTLTLGDRSGGIREVAEIIMLDGNVQLISVMDTIITPLNENAA